jgi:hypothetical protein
MCTIGTESEFIMAKPPLDVYSLKQWEGTNNNFAVLLKISSKWQVRIGTADNSFSTDENATRIAETGRPIFYSNAASYFPDFLVKGADYLEPLSGQNPYP